MRQGRQQRSSRIAHDASLPAVPLLQQAMRAKPAAAWVLGGAAALPEHR